MEDTPRSSADKSELSVNTIVSKVPSEKCPSEKQSVVDCPAMTWTAYNDTSAYPQTSQWVQPPENPAGVRVP